MKVLSFSSSCLAFCLLALGARANDADVLNSALNLEYLEANFYSCAAYGEPIEQALWGANGKEPMGCQQAMLTPTALAYAKAVAKDEIAHVSFLRQELGDNAVDQPQINIGAAFEAAANAALNTTLNPSFSAYGNDILFYHAAFIFEDVGVTAYKGAAPLLENVDTLEAAAGILAVEAYHGGAIRSLLLEQSEQTVFPFGAQVKAIVKAIADLRASVSGGNNDAGLFKPDSMDYILAPADQNAVVHTRSTQEVLNIIYLNADGSVGGFFPEGMNGNIN
ncbi:ferritin-like domain-containing protein [Dunaliella salina]|uniref:Ferritin-like domain-containing protein n=1 Tax=Dunaliella salina TaxID=3046 RepID=A0ABQ7G3Y5_DUNSA|nr:ferritin-like domain-containing protein [Dunaliella salina]|eukprot:KAF5829292.1 ferritin-like domain-containing protein [Dunaliella salina]